jgi:hypothetical protein
MAALHHDLGPRAIPVIAGPWASPRPAPSRPDTSGGHVISDIVSIIGRAACLVCDGDFSINFDNVRQVNPSLKVYGVLDEKLSNVGDPSLEATFVGAHNVKTDEVIDAAYRFSSSSAGGDLQIAFQSQGGTSATMSLHSRWDATGAGRGDARSYAASSTTTVTYGASECWDDAFTLTYDNDPAYGSVSYCASAFQGDAQYATLSVP